MRKKGGCPTERWRSVASLRTHSSRSCISMTVMAELAGPDTGPLCCGPVSARFRLLDDLLLRADQVIEDETVEGLVIPFRA
jgi:hypothetical protein